MCLQHDSLTSFTISSLRFIAFGDPSVALQDTSLHFAPFVRRSFVPLTSFGTHAREAPSIHFTHAYAVSFRAGFASPRTDQTRKQIHSTTFPASQFVAFLSVASLASPTRDKKIFPEEKFP